MFLNRQYKDEVSPFGLFNGITDPVWLSYWKGFLSYSCSTIYLSMRIQELSIIKSTLYRSSPSSREGGSTYSNVHTGRFMNPFFFLKSYPYHFHNFVQPIILSLSLCLSVSVCVSVCLSVCLCESLSLSRSLSLFLCVFVSVSLSVCLFPPPPLSLPLSFFLYFVLSLSLAFLLSVCPLHYLHHSADASIDHFIDLYCNKVSKICLPVLFSINFLIFSLRFLCFSFFYLFFHFPVSRTNTTRQVDIKLLKKDMCPTEVHSMLCGD